MAADTETTSGSRRLEGCYPKIVRAPDGSLAGASGDYDDCYAFSKWFAAGGMYNGKAEPEYNTNRDQEPCFLIVLKDRSVWLKWGRKNMVPVVAPHAIGIEIAAVMAVAAMHHGASAPEAVQYAIEHCTHVGGTIQIEWLHGGDSFK